eukprot:CAMPEP_0197075186 /NCGR_PEP_ID=MMETSP1384-20130603/211482_1 /TAXON_ID=29189 /ORGANISM="Ammonia sp." /LENGTH=196 /DNA_ID=CAMNT_0042514029 /DNA_START=161 /DNA_END=751 /DNA_ORIENTATION=-
MAKGGQSACTTLSCTDPCVGQCSEDEECITKDTNVQGCPACPVFFRCKANPGAAAKDPEEEVCPCITKDTNVQGCPACPVFFRCKANPGAAAKDLEEEEVCPQVACISPCPADQCGEDEECVTRDTTIRATGGCPGCPVFQRCKPDSGNNGNGVTPCGTAKCRGSTPVCCNASCGICRASGESCDNVECDSWANEP